MDNVKERMDIFFDKSAPSIVVDVKEYRNGYKNIRKRGGRIRAFTEITKENLHHCKELNEPSRRTETSRWGERRNCNK